MFNEKINYSNIPFKKVLVLYDFLNILQMETVYDTILYLDALPIKDDTSRKAMKTIFIENGYSRFFSCLRKFLIIQNNM